MNNLKVTFCIMGAVLAFALHAQTPPNLALQFSNDCAQITVAGTVSNACTVQFSTNLTQVNSWHFQTNFVLTSAQMQFCDSNQSAARFYRAFTQLLPTNVVPISNMVWISPGTFIMGSPTNEALRNSDETQHTVTLSRGFFMSKYLITQSDYMTLISTNPSFFTTNNGYTQNLSRPVEEVSWINATNYCALLTQQEMLAGRLPAGWVYRLPTESEWEYACRAGTLTAVYYGNELLSGMANFNGQLEYDASTGTINNPSGTFLSQTTVVGSYEANPWGLFDMCGNLYQWCEDLYGSYPTGSVTDPQGATTGTTRVLRNNGWNAAGQYCRSAQRDDFDPTGTFANAGFRIVLAPSP